MTCPRLVACTFLVGTLVLASPAAHADERSPVHQLQYERSLMELLANARVERVVAEVEVAFLEEQLAGEDWERLLFLLEDELVAELVDTQMEVELEAMAIRLRYGEKHPDRAAVEARLAVLDDALRREAGSVVEVRRLGLEMAMAMEVKFAAALVEAGSAVDEAAMEPALAATVAQLQTHELEARVEAQYHEQLLADGHGEQLARSLGKGGLLVLLLARMERQVADSQLALTYGDQHPERVALAEQLAALDTLLAAQTGEAVAASQLRVELLQRQIEAMEALRAGASGEGSKP